MLLARRTLCLAALGLLATGCSSPTSPTIAAASVVVLRDTVVAARVPAGTVTWVQFSLPVAIQNTGRAPVTFSFCVSAVDARTDGSWQTVWSPACALSSPGSTEIPAGGTRQFTITVIAAIEGPGGPEWRRAGIEGTYRFRAGLLPTGVGGRIPMVPSNSFTLSSGS